jgi:Cdc6-like AAA superfamily ATPase
LDEHPVPAQSVPLTDDEVDALWGDLTEAFSPGAPVLERDLFAGRITQLHTLVDSVQQRGRHSIVFGERGVGKTSLVNILKPALHSPTRPVVFAKVNAVPEDTFNTLWKKVFKRMSFDVRTDGGGTVRRTLGEDIYGEQSPDDVLLELGKIPPQYTPIVVIDEFDRLTDERPRVLLADTIKALSDYSSSTTVVVVGGADDVSELIRGHQSLARAVVQVKMPRMSQDELAQIIQSR